MITSAAQKILLRRRSCQASAARLRALPPPPAPAPPAGEPTGVSAVSAFMSLIADPGVEGGVEQVDDQVHDQEDDHQNADEADHQRAVLGADAAPEVEADPGDVE